MIITIIPSHNQQKHIAPIIRGFEQQTIKPDVVLFVFDRCKDDSVNVVKNIKTDLNVKYIEKTEGENFSAGLTRDYGIRYFDKDDYDFIVFIDGDCVPSPKLIEEHKMNMARTKKAAISCGRRIKETVDGDFEDDERNIGPWVNGFGFGKNGRVIVSSLLAAHSILSYSCNLALNKKAIEVCRKVNKVVSNDESRVFNSEFDGAWGGEDNFVSHTIYRTGNHILLTSNDCYVTHYYHPEQPRNVEGRQEILHKLDIYLQKNIIQGNIEGEVTKFYSKVDNNIAHESRENFYFFCNRVVEGRALELLSIMPDFDDTTKMSLIASFSPVYKSIGVEEPNYNFLDVRNYYDKHQFVNFCKFYLEDDKYVFENDLDKFVLKVEKSSNSYW